MAAQPPVEGISRELARDRASVISEVHYRLSLELVAGANDLNGHEVLDFKLAKATSSVTVDFRDGAIASLTVNGSQTEIHPANGHLTIPGNFPAGPNHIKLDFTSGIATAGRAITRYLDHDDGAEYIYSLFVPMDASQAFPCFDQPDLKARFQLTLTAPADWTVVSNTSATSTAPAKPGQRRTEFAQTPPLPTYLFAFAAGPFRSISKDGINLFVRQSKYDRAAQEAPEVLRTAHAGMRHLAEYFDRAFPFGKYDLVLIPGFPFGGMEHAGATFLREDSVLFRSVPTAGDKIQRAALVLHETAHQWFGDLVTMRWFDDLWLKEGFAQYMAYETLATLYPPDEIWKRFYQAFKPSAYAIDATHGTTPIHQSIANLKDAKSAYGAIVYSKTPGILRQLSYLIGEQAFRDGVRLFLREHEYGNAEWDDLIHAYERSSGKKLTDWADAWIKQPGMPQVDAVWQCTDGHIDSFTLRQKDVLGQNQFWPMRTQVFLDYGSSSSNRSVPVDLAGAETKAPELAGAPCPNYVFANDRDYGYGRFLLDTRSLEYVTAHVEGITDTFQRALLWGALWDGVRELQVAPASYIRLAIRALPSESDEALTQSVLAHTATAFQRYLWDPQRPKVAPELEAMLENRMQHAPDVSLRILYYRTFRSVATTPVALTTLKSMLAGKYRVEGLEIKPLDRWTMLTRLLAQGDSDAPGLLEAERQRDTTDDGRKYAFVAAAARPEPSVKRQYFKEYMENHALQEDWIEQSLGAFNSWNQPGLALPYLEPALNSLPQIKRERRIFFLLAWLNAFIGGQNSAGAVLVTREWLQVHRPEPDLERKVREVLDELDRTVRIRMRYRT